MKKPTAKTLRLSKQTIRTLQTTALANIASGLYTAGQSCTCPPKDSYEGSCGYA